VKQTHHSVPAGKNKPPVVVNVTKEPYILSHGFLYCKCCKIMVKWNNRSKHVIGKKHIANKNAAADTAEDLNEARTLAQQRIREEGLVGTTYTGDKLDSITLWLKVACAGNWSTASIEDNRVSGWFAVRHFSINPCSQVNCFFSVDATVRIERASSWQARDERQCAGLEQAASEEAR